jgi:fatty acid desaturase
MLHYAADRRTLATIAFYFAATAAVWLWGPEHWGFRLVSILALGYLSWTCAIITHNTIHAPMFRSKAANRWVQIVLTLTYGHPVSAFVPGHNLSHHRFTQKPQDVMRTTKVDLGWNLANVILFVPSVAIAVFRNDLVFSRVMKEKRPKWFRQFRIESAILALVSIALLLIDWQKFLMFFWVPHIMAAVGIIGINYLQHDGCDEDHPYNHSRNFTGRAFGWLTFNNGFHGIHHMKPSLHWSLLREVHDRDVKPHLHPALDQPSILLYMWRAFVWPGRRMRYDGTPVVLERVPDVPWVRDELPTDASYGAEASA